MKSSKQPRKSKRQSTAIAPKKTLDLAARFREWQRLRKQVRDFERAAGHNIETIERHEREIEKTENEPDDDPETSSASG